MSSDQKSTVNAAAWKSFYADPEYWPEGAVHDDVLILVNGVADETPLSEPEKLSDSDVITIESGDVFLSGDIMAKPDYDLAEYFDKWVANMSFTRATVSIPKHKMAQFNTMVRSLGGDFISES